MSAGNPFRRARGARIPDNDTAVTRDTNATQKKKKKSVTIQTPPHSPEEPRRLSAGRVSPPPPSRGSDDEESSDGTTTADSDVESAMRNTGRDFEPLGQATGSALGVGEGPGGGGSNGQGKGAPYNPFARTLATSEAAFGLQRSSVGQEETRRPGVEADNAAGAIGRPAMDVDQFKNILMTGSAIPSASGPYAAPAQQGARFQDSSSNTDTSSTSQQSLFDPYFEIHQETPRSSLDQIYPPSDSSDGEHEEQSGLMSGSVRLDDFAPPAPPKAAIGRPAMPKRPVTVSFADFDEEITDASRTRTPPLSINTTGHMRAPLALHRSPSDLNKPLPPPPAEPLRSPELPRVEVEEGTPVTQDVREIDNIDDSTEAKKAPPPPPASRRGNPIQTPGRARSSSNGTQNSSHDDFTTTQPKIQETIAKPAPPPPPSRKTKASSQPALPTRQTLAAETTPAPASHPISPPRSTASPVPPPPPRRMASKAGNSVVRTPSTASRSSVQQKEYSTLNTSAPPAPPRRRGLGNKRESTEVVQRSGSDGSAQAESSDMLADLAAFQAEIDALRARTGQQPG